MPVQKREREETGMEIVTALVIVILLVVLIRLL